MTDPGRSFVHCPAALFVVTLLAVAAPAQAQDAHGAIAFGKSAEGKDAAYGFAWNYSTREEALAAARNACLGAGGANCVDLARFRNGCGALAMDRYGGAQGKSAMSRERAETRAMQACKSGEEAGCAIVAAVCAEPGEQPAQWSGSDSVRAAPSVGTAARQESGPVTAGEASEKALTRADRIGVQRGLAALGFDAGLADGMFGPRTRSAIRAWQQAKGLAPTGNLNRDEARAIAAAAAESGKGSPPGEAPAQARAAERLLPKCKGMVKGSKCWKEVSHRPGCHVWDVYFYPDQTAAWTGACPGGAAHGRGTLLWSSTDSYSEDMGEMVGGRSKGPWTLRHYDARKDADPFKGPKQFEEGPYVDGERHGHWVRKYPPGTSSAGVHEGPYVDGEPHGRWVSRWDTGDRFEGQVRDGKPNGFGTYTRANGTKSEGQWRDGCFDDGRGTRHAVWTTNKSCGFE